MFHAKQINTLFVSQCFQRVSNILATIRLRGKAIKSQNKEKGGKQHDFSTKHIGCPERDQLLFNLDANWRE